MKPLYWKRIQIPKKDLGKNGSVWSKINDVPISADEMEAAFCKKTNVKKSKALSDLMTEKKKIKAAKILEDKRSQAVGIFLSSLHIEMTDLQNAILNLDITIVDEESMKSIYDLRAKSDELKSIKSHIESQKNKKDEEKQGLDKPEKFLYSLHEIDNFEDRLFCITFRTTFNEDIQEIQKELLNINTAVQELQDPETVLRVLGLVLSVGNYLNGGNRTRGQADGFQLEILSKLKDVKGEKDGASFSLLNYIVWAYIRTYDQEIPPKERDCPVPTFQKVVLASQVNYSEVMKELKRVRKGLKDCEKRVSDVIKKSKKHSQPFKSKMETFLQNAYTSLETHETDCEESRKRFQEAVEFFCVKPKSSSKPVEPKDFFSLWQTFCLDFHGIWQLEIKRYLKEVLHSMNKRVENASTKQATTVVVKARRRPGSMKTRASPLSSTKVNIDSGNDRRT